MVAARGVFQQECKYSEKNLKVKFKENPAPQYPSTDTVPDCSRYP